MILAKLWKVNDVEVFYNYDYIEANRDALYSVLADDSATCLDIYGNAYANDLAIGDLIEMVDFLPPINLVDRMYRNQKVGSFITALLREEIHGVENKALYLAELSNAINVVSIGMLRTGSEYLDLIDGDDNLTASMLERWSSLLKSADAVPFDSGQTPISSNTNIGAYLGLSWDGNDLDVTGSVKSPTFLQDDGFRITYTSSTDKSYFAPRKNGADNFGAELGYRHSLDYWECETDFHIRDDLNVDGSGTFENSKIRLKDTLVTDSYMPSDLSTAGDHRSIGFGRTNDGTFRSYVGTYRAGNEFDYNTVYGSRYEHVWMSDIYERMRLSSSGNLDVTGSGTFGATGIFTGTTKVGAISYSNWSEFRNGALVGNDKGALLQNTAGKTHLQCASGQSISFRKENVEMGSFDSAGDFNVVNDLNVTGSVTLDNSNFLIDAPTASGTKGLLFYRGGVERGRFDFDYSLSRARIQADGDIKFYTNGENERMAIANNGDVTINNDLDVTGSVTASNIFDMVPSTIVGTSLAQTVTSSNAQIDLTDIKVDGSSTDYSISTASNNITFTNGDGSKIYEVTALVRYDLQSQGVAGATRSYVILSPRIGGTVDTDYEVWTYIREFQGGSQGTPSNSGTLTFQFQPTASQTLDFVVRGETDSGQTITDFDVDGIVVTVKRLK